MTPDEHAAKAAALAQRAEQLAILADQHAAAVTAPLDQANALARLAQVHALLALRPTRTWPSHVPTDEVVDYGDGFPH